jgi:hypothetical protein
MPRNLERTASESRFYILAKMLPPNVGTDGRRKDQQLNCDMGGGNGDEEGYRLTDADAHDQHRGSNNIDGYYQRDPSVDEAARPGARFPRGIALCGLSPRLRQACVHQAMDAL